MELLVNAVLANVTLPTSLLVIDIQAFGWFCSKLQSLVLPTYDGFTNSYHSRK